MKTSLKSAGWWEGKPSRRLLEATGLLDGVWRTAATEFFAQKLAKERAGLKAPKGVQTFLNSAIDDVFQRAGWEGDAGRFWSDDMWIRITFRHQMSLGSDVLDALRVCRKEGVGEAAILAAPLSFLNLISPNDAAALTSYEKLSVLIAELEGCLDIPLFIGRVDPISQLPADVAQVVKAGRPRDIYMPKEGR